MTTNINGTIVKRNRALHWCGMSAVLAATALIAAVVLLGPGQRSSHTVVNTKPPAQTVPGPVEPTSLPVRRS
jgi:hypothetical protein